MRIFNRLNNRLSRLLNSTQTACLVWMIYIVIICLLTAFSGYKRSVVPSYFSGAQNWLHGLGLYTGTGQGFLYFPQSAIAYIPFAILPVHLGEIIWRIIIITVFAYGIFKFSTLARTDLVRTDKKTLNYFLIMTFFTLPLAFSAALNGQMTLLVSGLMMIATFYITQKRWWYASILLILGLALKPICLVWLLLVAALYPRQMIVRLLIGFAIMLCLPFLTQHPSYVLLQYRAVFDLLHSVNVVGTTTGWAEIFTLLQVFGLKVSLFLATVIRLFAALGTLMLCIKVKNKFNAQQTGFYLYLLGTCYLLLFNPINENNDHAMLAPVLGFLVLEAFELKKYGKVIFTLLCATAMVFTYYLSIHFISGNPNWGSPLIALVFSLAAIGWIWQQPKSYLSK